MNKKLPWKFIEETQTWEVEVPVNLYGTSTGTWKVWFEKRPAYCDRGRWVCNVDGVGVSGPDDQEGFPRYYFNLDYGKEEMETWIACRKEVVAKELVILHDQALEDGKANDQQGTT